MKTLTLPLKPNHDEGNVKQPEKKKKLKNSIERILYYQKLGLAFKVVLLHFSVVGEFQSVFKTR